MKLEQGQYAYLYKNDYGYSIRLSKKTNKNSDSYVASFIPVKLSNRIGGIPSKTKIELVDSWLSFQFNNNTGKSYTYIFINDLKILDSE